MTTALHVAKTLTELGRGVRAARERNGWSTTELATRAEVDYDDVAALEQGRSMASITIVLAAVHALDLDIRLVDDDAEAVPERA